MSKQISMEEFLNEKRINCSKFIEQKFGKEKEFEKFSNMFKMMRDANINEFALYVRSKLLPFEDKLDSIINTFAGAANFDLKKLDDETRNKINAYLKCFIVTVKQIA